MSNNFSKCFMMFDHFRVDTTNYHHLGVVHEIFTKLGRLKVLYYLADSDSFWAELWSGLLSREHGDGKGLSNS